MAGVCVDADGFELVRSRRKGKQRKVADGSLPVEEDVLDADAVTRSLAAVATSRCAS